MHPRRGYTNWPLPTKELRSWPAVRWRPSQARRPAAVLRTSGSPRARRAWRRSGGGGVTFPASDESFLACRQQALEFLGKQPGIYVVDGYAGWDPAYRIKVRVICSRAYHALFMHNLLIRASTEEFDRFGEPE